MSDINDTTQSMGDLPPGLHQRCKTATGFQEDLQYEKPDRDLKHFLRNDSIKKRQSQQGWTSSFNLLAKKENLRVMKIKHQW